MSTEPLSVVVANKKGGVGKSTLTLVLACALVERGCRVRVLDLDRRQITVFAVLKNQRKGTVGASIIRDQEPGLEQVVLIDCPPSSEHGPEQALSTAHLVVVPTTQEGLDVSATMSFCAGLQAQIAEGTEVRVVLSKWERGRVNARDLLAGAQDLFPYPVLPQPLSKRAATSAAMMSDDLWASLHPDTREEGRKLLDLLPLLRDVNP